MQTIPSRNIDIKKWDNCVKINKAPIYCSSIYLNTMADNWVGLVLDDYKAIFPICFRKKWGITYTYVPAFMQQLGFIGQTQDWALIENELLKFVKYGDIMFNHRNNFLAAETVEKTNYIINLDKPYQHISNNYKNDLKQNLKKAAKQNFVYEESIDTERAIDLYRNYYGQRMEDIRTESFMNLKNLSIDLQKEKSCLVRQVVSSRGQLLAIALLLKDDNRIYNIANSTTVLGRRTVANHFLIDSILKEFAGSHLIFDFEGSDLLGVKQFYKKFGAINQPYFHWHFNKLPWYIKWIKQ